MTTSVPAAAILNRIAEFGDEVPGLSPVFGAWLAAVPELVISLVRLEAGA